MNPSLLQAVSVTAAGVCLAGTSAYLSPWLWRQSRMAAIRQQAMRQRMLALTYDDGPSHGITPRVLDLLSKRNARATFFLLGRNAQQNPDIADRILQEGHAIGCHSQRHLNAWKVSPWSAIDDIRSGYEQMAAWIPPNAVFRPPFGKISLPTFLYLTMRRAPVCWWTVDSGDTYTKLPPPAKIVDTVRRNNGGIVLMHDLDRGEERNHFVLKLTATLLDTAAVEGLKVVSLKELSL